MNLEVGMSVDKIIITSLIVIALILAIALTVRGKRRKRTK